MNQMQTGMQLQIQAQINSLQNQIADAKKNNAPAAEIKKLEQRLQLMKSALQSIGQMAANLKQTKFKGDPGPKWTGYLSAEKTSSSTFPVSSREAHVYLNFNEAIPTLHRVFNENDELDFKDDKGIGSVTDHAVTQVGTQTYTCDCSATGEAELHEVVVNFQAKTYTIQADAPLCSGGNGDDGTCGITWDISIPDEPLKNSNVLAGSKTYTEQIGEFKATVKLTWYLVRSYDIELIIKPVEYDTWLPEPGKDEKTKGNTMTVQLVLQGKNGKPLSQRPSFFRIRLENTSREPGITINYPIKPLSPSPPDLQLEDALAMDHDKEHQYMQIQSYLLPTATFRVNSFDGGGYSTLTATAVLEDGSVITGHLFTSSGTAEISIPKRNGSFIGEAWLKENNNPGDKDDKEISTGNNYNGDGLTAYEEYRGVISRGMFLRLDPQKKELGIYVNSSEQGFFEDGIELFEKASHLTAVWFEDMEIDLSERRLNKNAKSAHDYDQYVLWLFQSIIPGNKAIGKAYGGPGPPNKTYSVVIDAVMANREYQYWSNCARGMGVKLPFTLQDLIAKTIAHELGHGVNCWHHGPTNKVTANAAREIVEKEAKKYLIINHDGTEITDHSFPLVGYVGGKNNLESGDLSCYMIYQPFYQWSLTVKNNLPAFLMTPLLPLSHEFCTSKYGTGINEEMKGENDFFGDAKWGNCLAQIKLKE
ncbi:MAG TPA: hypothetical protein VFH08_04550 [Chitinophagaceae bacterium]|nr:hypothetical protein [Chitinophagaceae bacterium]